MSVLAIAPALACDDGQVQKCKRPDGTAGTKVCVQGKWTGCDVNTSHPKRLVGDANDPASILRDADRFQALYLGSDDAEIAWIDDSFSKGAPPYWDLQQETSALVQMYDLVAPLDHARALRYLERLRRISVALLANRDDRRTQPQVDFFRNRVMPAWGAITADRDGRWNTDVVTAGVFTYAMAAFARRVAQDPALQSQYAADATWFISEAIETYRAFLPEQHLKDNDPHAYFTVPASYADLHCEGDTESACDGYRKTAGQPLSYNENLSMMKALAETALAASSQMYRNSSQSNPLKLFLATTVAPRLIAKNVAYFRSAVHTQNVQGTLLAYWNHQEPLPREQDTAHAGFELGSLAVVYELKDKLNELLWAAHKPERINLPTEFFRPIANTFLRRTWKYDYQNPDGPRNILSKNVAGSGDATDASNANIECAGWIPLAQFDKWMWIRCRDVTEHPPGYFRVDNHAALLRYRRYGFQ